MHFDLAGGALWYAVFLLSTVFHEAAHAWSALRLGDDTASRGGQVSLNPLPHIKRAPFGMVIIPIASWFLSGWMMGWASAPYDAAWARQFPKRCALMSLAGPAANLTLVLGAALLIRLGVEWHVFTAPYTIGMSRIATAVDAGFFEFAAKLLSIVFSLNLLLCVFNLLPVPPLDGGSLPLFVLPERAARVYFDTMNSPMLQMVGIVIVSRGFGTFFPPILRFAASLLHPGSHYH